MLNQSEESAGSSTAPRPELNPLLNPLLAENMKRWAEVYFSAAPEDRDKAVRALLEELREKQMNAFPGQRSAPDVADLHDRASISAQPDTIACLQCGQENPRQYQFCGNCGYELARIEVAEETEANHSHTADWQRWEDPVYSEDDAAERHDSRASSYGSSGYHGLSILQGGSEAEWETQSDVPNFMYEAPRHRYRAYLGLFLALVIAGLGYKAWKATKGNENTYTPPPPPVSAAESNPPAEAAENAAATKNSDSDVAANSAASTKTNASAPRDKKTQDLESAPQETETKSKREDESAEAGQRKTSRGKGSIPTQPIPSTSATNGSEELSVAQRYLGGQNSAQAAPWLWKSVSKHNGEATLLLADLYLKGDGVSKNCDQARVLLDSAARKGIAGAGERLRHLAAFGCQ